MFRTSDVVGHHRIQPLSYHTFPYLVLSSYCVLLTPELHFTRPLSSRSVLDLLSSEALPYCTFVIPTYQRYRTCILHDVRFLLLLTFDMPCWYWNNVAPALLLDRTCVVLDGLHIAPVFVRVHRYCTVPDLRCCSAQVYVCGLYVFNLLVLRLNTDQPAILRVHL